MPMVTRAVVTEWVGAGVTDLPPGDEVYYTPETNSRRLDEMRPCSNTARCFR